MGAAIPETRLPDLPFHPAADGGPAVDWKVVRRLLIVRPDNLGDVLLLTPALRALRDACPTARLDLLASPAGAAVAPLIAELDRVLTVSPVWQDADGRLPQDPGRERALVERMAAERYDAAFIFTSFSQSPWPAAYLLYLAGVPMRIATSREFGGSLLSHWVSPPAEDAHQVDRALHLLAAVGVTPVGTDLRVQVPAASEARARQALRSVGVPPDTPYAVIAPGASCPARRWAPPRFREVAARLAAAGLAVVVTGSERERELVAEVADAPGAVGLAGDLDVPALAGLFAGASVAVTNNSGGMHLAEALGTPLVVAFAGTELERQYAPRRTPTRLLRRPTSCAPCRAFACQFQQQCLDIEPEEVVASALALLAREVA